MAVIVSLRDFVDELQMLSDEISAYLNKITGEVILITNDDFETVESDDDWRESSGGLERAFYQKVAKVFSSDDYLKLPDQFEIHEYEIMERFCLSIPNKKTADVILSRMRGSGAFRRFKELIFQYEIEKDWYKFRDEALKEIAISWLENHGFAYADDMNRRS